MGVPWAAVLEGFAFWTSFSFSLFAAASSLSVLALSAASFKALSRSSSDRTLVNLVISEAGGGLSRTFPDLSLTFSDLGVSVFDGFSLAVLAGVVPTGVVGVLAALLGC